MDSETLKRITKMAEATIEQDANLVISPEMVLDLTGEIERLQSALATLRAAAQAVIEQTDRDQAVGLGRQFSRLDLYEVVLTSEQVEALRAALAGGGNE